MRGGGEGDKMKDLFVGIASSIIFILQMVSAMLYAMQLQNKKTRERLLWIDGSILFGGMLILTVLFSIALKSA